MKFWVGVTDKDWFQFLTNIRPDEANFWQPSGSRSFRALQPGEPFLFKLHSPDNFIVGGGYFVRYSALPASLAWDAFGEKNGVASLDALCDRVRRYRRIDEAVDPAAARKQKIDEYKAEFANPYKAARRGYVDDVIEPGQTRARLAAALALLLGKREARPSRKHGNMPL